MTMRTVPERNSPSVKPTPRIANKEKQRYNVDRARQKRNIKKIATATLLALTSCVDIPIVEPSNDTSAVAAKRLIDLIAAQPNPRDCDELIEQIYEQAYFFEPEIVPDGDSLTVILNDERTMVTVWARPQPNPDSA